VNDVKDEKFEAVLSVGIAEFFGLGVSTYKYQSSWQKVTSKEMKSFKNKLVKMFSKMQMILIIWLIMPG